MSRVAIIHYTLSPAIGGIESLIEAQTRALLELGHEVVLVAGSGDSPDGVETRLIPAMLPPGGSGSEIARGTAHDAASLLAALRTALDHCDVCWVHNVLSLGLHSPLTEAIWRLVASEPGKTWIAWCEDLSAVSAFWSGATARPKVHPRVRYATISPARAQELQSVLGEPHEPIVTIQPPLQTEDWLVTNPQTRAIVDRLDLASPGPTVFVPAKLLPHKRLELAVDVCAALQALRESTCMVITGAPSPHEPERSRAVEAQLCERIEQHGLHGRVHVLTSVLGQRLERGAVRDLMALCDVTYVPSAEEGFGMPLLEASALRVPVVCTDIPAFRISGPNAHFVPPHAPAEAIATAILNAADTPTNRARRSVLQSWSRFRAEIAAIVPDAR